MYEPRVKLRKKLQAYAVLPFHTWFEFTWNLKLEKRQCKISTSNLRPVLKCLDADDARLENWLHETIKIILILKIGCFKVAKANNSGLKWKSCVSGMQVHVIAESNFASNKR